MEWIVLAAVAVAGFVLGRYLFVPIDADSWTRMDNVASWWRRLGYRYNEWKERRRVARLTPEQLEAEKREKLRRSAELDQRLRELYGEGGPLGHWAPGSSARIFFSVDRASEGTLYSEHMDEVRKKMGT